MTREATKLQKAAIRSEVTRVRQMLNEWDPLSDSPPDEYDCVADGVVSALHRGVSAAGLADWICQEFDRHFGVPVSRDEALSMSSRTLSWWSDSQRPNPRT